MVKIHLEEVEVGFGVKEDSRQGNSSMKTYLKTLHHSSIWMDKGGVVEVVKGLILWLI